MYIVNLYRDVYTHESIEVGEKFRTDTLWEDQIFESLDEISRSVQSEHLHLNWSGVLDSWAWLEEIDSDSNMRGEFESKSLHITHMDKSKLTLDEQLELSKLLKIKVVT